MILIFRSWGQCKKFKRNAYKANFYFKSTEEFWWFLLLSQSVGCLFISLACTAWWLVIVNYSIEDSSFVQTSIVTRLSSQLLISFRFSVNISEVQTVIISRTRAWLIVISHDNLYYWLLVDWFVALSFLFMTRNL